MKHSEGRGAFGGGWDELLGNVYSLIKNDTRKMGCCFYSVALCLHMMPGNCGSLLIIRKQVSTGTIKSNEDGRTKNENNLGLKLLNYNQLGKHPTLGLQITNFLYCLSSLSQRIMSLATKGLLINIPPYKKIKEEKSEWKDW